jgi:alpha-tubulin suppressor-like RCC1 family protein
VECWGANYWGNLGIADPVSTNAATTPVPLPAPAKDVQAPGPHACAIVQGGDLYCWGSNETGELGIGTTDFDPHPAPTLVPLGGRNVTDVAVGDWHTCALLRNGQVKCWGDNTYGQLGDGTATSNPSPGTAVPLGALAISISAGGSHTCAVLETGAMKCWGANFDGQLGIGAFDPFQSLIPADVVGLAGPAVSVSCGNIHTCALLADNRLECWGNNAAGQTGRLPIIPTDPNEWVPPLDPAPDVIDVGFPVDSVSSGFSHTCAVSTTGDLKCWGFNGDGILGRSCSSPDCQSTYGYPPSAFDNVQF